VAGTRTANEDKNESAENTHANDDYVLLGSATQLTRNGKATATEANRGKGKA
jgi:hypothetical protein